MKAKSKSELAMAAGVSLGTLARWMKPYRQELEALGMRPGMPASQGGEIPVGPLLHRRG